MKWKTFSLISSLALFSSLGWMSWHSPHTAPLDITQLVQEKPQQEASSGSDKQAPSSESSQEAQILPASTIFAPKEQELEVRVERGQTLNMILRNAGLSKEEASAVIQAIRKSIDPRDLKVGQIIKLHVREEQAGSPVLLDRLSYRPTVQEELTLTRDESGKYKLGIHKVLLKKALRHVEGTIKGSFYSAAAKQGVPIPVIREATVALSYDMNMQHELKKDDAFELVYTTLEDEQGQIVKVEGLQYIAIATRAKLRRIFHHAGGTGRGSYYSPEGESFVRALLGTPLDATHMRVTSKFSSSRPHPILKFSRAHKGTDYGARVGAQVYAAGEGRVLKAGYFGNYGKYILLEHAGGYKTAYAHLNSISVRVGQTVKQRQKIGTVGTTGLSSGPHLHHEVIYRGVHVDPQRHLSKLPAQKLSGRDLEKFKAAKREIEQFLKAQEVSYGHVLRPTSAVHGQDDP